MRIFRLRNFLGRGSAHDSSDTIRSPHAVVLDDWFSAASLLFPRSQASVFNFLDNTGRRRWRTAYAYYLCSTTSLLFQLRLIGESQLSDCRYRLQTDLGKRTSDVAVLKRP